MGYVKRIIEEANSINDIDWYYEWLCEKVDLLNPKKCYSIIAKILWDTEFYDLLQMDYNRVLDAHNLRASYCPDLPPEIKDSPASFLEVLVAFSIRIEQDMFGRTKKNMNPKRWFFEMIENMFELDFTLLEDNSIYKIIVKGDLSVHEKLQKKIERVLERTYSYNGKGGLFPLKKCATDQRMEELWYQMQSYMQQVHREELFGRKMW